MDDALKLQKLAAARNKLKSHQQKKHKKPDHATNDSRSNDSSQNNTPSPAELELQRNHSPLPNIQSYFGEPAASLTSRPPQTQITPSTATFFDNIQPSHHFSTESRNVSEPGPDSVAIEDPEINPNEVFDFTNHNQNETHQLNDNISTTEQLKQLNDQITQLVVDTNGYENYSNYSDLEKRNLELASSYEKERVQREQQNVELVEYKSRVNDLERQMEFLKIECENRIRHELGPLENEVTNHRQTFGILVGEKTELSASLNHSQLLLKQKTMECEELAARLKTSRSRVADLEKEVGGLKDEKGRFAQLQSGHNQVVEKVQEELEELRVNKTEAEQDLSEMRERLKKVQEDNSKLAHSCNEYESKLGLANLKIQQLTTGIDPSASERFMQEKLSLEKQILDLNSSLKVALADRDQASTQYQQYVQQLNGNISSLAEKLESSSTHNETLIQRERELVSHISDLEKRLQNLQQETVNNIYKQQFHEHELPKEPDPNVELLKKHLQDLETSNTDLQTKFETVRAERDEFIKDVEHKKVTIEDLESVIERLKGSQSNNTQLLAEIESDKVAASRAIEQNMKLKQQLEEMQEAFIRMTNDKAELLTQLSSEQFRHKELEDLHMLTNQQKHTLTEAIEIKDRELTDMRMQFEQFNRDTLQQDQLNDRLRHYEAHENSVHAISNELQKAREEIQVLIEKNKQLEVKLLDSLKNASVNRLGQEVQAESLEIQVAAEVVNQAVQTHEISTPTVSSLLATSEIASNDELSPREIAMRQLETKFMRTMQEIANLQDEKQMLEHIVLQLQGETETIGEYITLYQHQRGVLKQRAIEKETQVKQLSIDREHMKTQLQLLNDLVRRLLAENRISDGILREHETLNQNASTLCEEHAKVHHHELELGGNELVAGGDRDVKDDCSSHETAQKIMALLGEIKTSNLVQPTDVSDSFHPCPLCSGQLITV